MKLNRGVALESLNLQFCENATRWIRDVEKEFPQFIVRITSGRRTADQQEALFRQNSADRWVTNCDGRKALSMHQYGLAIDIALERRSTGKIDWDSRTYRTVYARVKPNDYGLELIPQEQVHLQLAGSQARYAAGKLSQAYIKQLGLVVS